MLERKDYATNDLESPFFGKNVDVCSANSKTASVTNVSTRYADLVRAIRKDNSRPSWTEGELLELQQQICRFETRTLAVFGA